MFNYDEGTLNAYTIDKKINIEFLTHDFDKYELEMNYDELRQHNKIFKIDITLIDDILKIKPCVICSPENVIVKYEIPILKRDYQINFELIPEQTEGKENYVRIRRESIYIKNIVHQLVVDFHKLDLINNAFTLISKNIQIDKNNYINSLLPIDVNQSKDFLKNYVNIDKNKINDVKFNLQLLKKNGLELINIKYHEEHIIAQVIKNKQQTYDYKTKFIKQLKKHDYNNIIHVDNTDIIVIKNEKKS